MDQYATLINNVSGVNQYINKSKFHDEMLVVAIEPRLEEKYLEACLLL